MATPQLPDDIRVLERGWLSSNNVLLLSGECAALVDSGYATHAAQTLALVETALESRPLDLLVNTHLHSDHCGGNAALQARYTEMRTLIPPGQADHVRHWDAYALSYRPTGQFCPPFHFNDLLVPGSSLRFGEREWEIHATPGHDPHSVLLFEPELRILISADALWENGFGVVFPEIEGNAAFAEVGQTLDLIEFLHPRLVIPGHGAVFAQVGSALQSARQRLAEFVSAPLRHARYAAKVLIKFKLLEQQRMDLPELWHWVLQTPYFSLLHQTYFHQEPLMAWAQGLVQELLRSGALKLDGSQLFNQ